MIPKFKEPQAQPTGVPTWTKGEGWTNTKPTTSWAEFKTIKGLKSEVGIGAKAELATTIGSKHTFETMRASGKPLVVGTGAAAVRATRPAKGEPTESQLKTFEVAKTRTSNARDIIDLTEPHSPVKINEQAVSEVK